MNETLQNQRAAFAMKFTVIGNMAVGKTSVVQTWYNETETSSMTATVMVDFLGKNVKVDNEVVSIQIWDTAGSEKFQSIMTSYYKNAAGIAIIFDLTNRDSFQKCQEWYDKTQDLCLPTSVVILIGNKSDMGGRQVTFEAAAAFA
jgi:small GTP-binding protein